MQQQGVVNSKKMDGRGQANTGCQATLEEKSHRVKRARGDFPGELINSAKVAAGPFDGTVSMCALSQSSHLKHCAGVKEGVRGAALGSTSDLGKMGETIVETTKQSQVMVAEAAAYFHGSVR